MVLRAAAFRIDSIRAWAKLRVPMLPAWRIALIDWLAMAWTPWARAQFTVMRIAYRNGVLLMIRTPASRRK